MAGATLELLLHGNENIDAALQQLIDDIAHPQPALKEVGEYLDLAHRLRWDAQQAPDGSSWEPLAPATLARKQQRNQPTDILVQSTFMRDTLRYQLTPFGLLFGTDRIYGASHQFGREEAGIPAREWLGLSDDDGDEVQAILEAHLRP